MQKQLISQLNPGGYWKGKLSSSALSTATAIFAIATADFTNHHYIVRSGLEWLEKNINEDGGFGDTSDSESNLSTTLLVWSAFSLENKFEKDFSKTIQRIEEYLKHKIGSLEPEKLAQALLDHYAEDRTFSVPILVMCASAGRLGNFPDCWKKIPQLPFELSLLPHSMFRIIRLPVVSYAMPALISMGIVKHHFTPTWCPVKRPIRWWAKSRALKHLETIQPENGGFLEATPLTSFVTMSLAKAGLKDNIIVDKGLKFLLASVREDGSWPIDTNLATWLTSLSVKALPDDALSVNQKKTIREWLLSQQYKFKHPYTNADPGGWAWTNLPGGTPDADDTAGVIIALAKLEPNYDNQDREDTAMKSLINAVSNGIIWLLNLQNKDGGIPTFCRGWGKLPFDRSCPDITAHVLKAFATWQEILPKKLQEKMASASLNMLQYLKKTQRPDGSWIPLWFGNQNNPDKTNPVYGTAQVMIGLESYFQSHPKITKWACKGYDFLRNSQNPDNGWGTKLKASDLVNTDTAALRFVSSIEETGLAITALAGSTNTADQEIAQQGMEYIETRMKSGKISPAPIGLYFASLWYSEKLYPLIFSVQAKSALNRKEAKLSKK